jgi:hypothetical protein
MTPHSPSRSEQAEILRNAMLFSLTRHVWTNRRQADKTKVSTTADKTKLNLTKQLLSSPELDAITEHLAQIYDWCKNHAVTGTRKGMYFVKRDLISEFESRLLAAQTKLHNELIPAFAATYDESKVEMQLDETRGGLGDLYRESDYPLASELPGLFSIEWSWLALSVPDELPEEVRQRENVKLRESFERAQEDIRYALRAGFKKLIEHAQDRLTLRDGEKPKKFYDSTITNITDFFETFNARNILGDAELEAVVKKARAVVAGLPESIEDLKNTGSLRDAAASQFAEVAKSLNSLVIDKPRRQFNDEA